MAKVVDPKEFGLPPRTVLEEIGPNEIALVIIRKSRIIMADGKKILAKVRKIQTIRPDVDVTLRTSAPVCSKTSQFFEREGVKVILN